MPAGYQRCIWQVVWSISCESGNRLAIFTSRMAAMSFKKIIIIFLTNYSLCTHGADSYLDISKILTDHYQEIKKFLKIESGLISCEYKRLAYDLRREWYSNIGTSIEEKYLQKINNLYQQTTASEEETGTKPKYDSRLMMAISELNGFVKGVRINLIDSNVITAVVNPSYCTEMILKYESYARELASSKES